MGGNKNLTNICRDCLKPQSYANMTDTCMDCGSPIYEGDEFYDIHGTMVCCDCINEYKKTAVYE